METTHSNPPVNSRLEQPVIYRIMVKGRLDSSWSDWFDQLTVSVISDNDGQSLTTLSGPVVDQAALHSLLARIRDLGLTLLLVQCLEPARSSTPAT